MLNKSLIAVTTAALLSSGLYANEILDDIVITSKSNKTIENTAGAVTIITAEDIKKSNASSIKDILVETSGIITTANESSISGRQTISIRGSASSHVLILVDGKKVSGSDAQIGHSDFQYNWVPMNSIDRIEVIKGAMSSIYGSQAIGGVVNIITKKSNKDFYGDIDLKAGSSANNGGDAKDVSLNIGGKVTSNLSVILSAEKRDLDAVVDEDDSTVTKIEGKKITNGGIKVQYDIDETQSVDASFNAGSEDRYQVEDTLYYDIERKNYSLGYSKRFEDITLDLDYYVTDSDLHYNSTSSTGGYTHNMTDTVVKGEVGIASLDKNYIVLGAETKNEEYDKVYDLSASSSNNFQNEIKNNSFFLQDEIELGDDFLFTIGSRYDDNEKFGGEWSPKANLIYKLSENQRIKVGYGEGFNAPTVTQNSSSYTSTSRHIFTGNDDLMPETSKSFELGYEYYGKDVIFKSAIYKTNVENLIETERTVDNATGPDYYTYVNVSKANMKGLELEVDYDINDSNSLKVNYNYLKTEDESDGSELSFKPKHSANVRLSSALPYNINSTISAKYIGKQLVDTDIYGAYTLVNLQFSKEMAKNLTARIGVDNLTNRDLNDEPYEIKGRFIYLGINYQF